MPDPPKRIMISSVMKNFSDVRRAISNVILFSDNKPEMAEHEESDSPSVQTIKDLVEKSHCYIGIFHKKWGWVPEENNQDNLSVTALEYDFAKKKGMPIAIFVSRLKKEQPLQDFLDKIGECKAGEWFHTYDTKEELLGKIGVKIQKLISRLSEQNKTLEDVKSDLITFNEKTILLIRDNVDSIYEEPKELEEIKKSISRNDIWLIGQRGIGKSTILKKLVEYYIENKKNCLILRSEDIQAKGFQNVTKNDIGLTINEIVSMFTTNQEPLLLIVDSVEALRRNEDVWSDFSSDMISILENSFIKTVLSIRKSDFNVYAESFHSDWGEQIILNGLEKEQIERILEKIRLKDTISDDLYPILKQPFYLEILDTLMKSGKTESISSLSTQSQFFKTHYEQIVRNTSKWTELVEKRVNLLLDISEKMFQAQRFKLPNFKFVATPEFDSLRTDGIIIDEEGFIQFFHQIYFDFLMSIKIITEGTIEKFLIKVGNEPFLKSTIQFTLSLLRDDDFENYLKNIQEISNSENVDEYWKKDTIGFIGQLTNLKDGEEEIIKNILINSPDLQKYFFDSVLEYKNPFWFSLWQNSVLITWSEDGDFKHSELLTKYISKSNRWLNE